MNKLTRNTLRALAPVVVLAAGAGIAYWVVESRPEVATKPPEVPLPLVSVMEAEREEVRLVVRTQGEVVPRTSSVLVSEVAGRVTGISPSMANGGFLEQGEVLVTIDATDYQLALAEAKLGVSQAELRVAREEADAELALAEWDDIGRGEPTPLTLHVPQLAEARATLEAARARLDRARRDVERCELRAPFEGRCWSKRVDIGQFVSRGSTLAELYATDYAEVRLPLPDAELAYLDLPLEARPEGPHPRVVLRARFGGAERTWEGHIVRTEAEIDPRNRMVVTVAQVEDPYGRGEEMDRPPLSVGMFVRAEIEGQTIGNAVSLPRAALQGLDTILVVDGQDRLRIREVDVLRRERERVVLTGGIEPGERVVVSPMEITVEGMQVRPIPLELESR